MTADQLADIDADVLRQRYRDERDKRLRDDGNDQYLDVVGQYAHFVDDPYVEAGLSRDPLTDDVEVVVIGGGFGGLLAGARLRDAGIADVRIIEKGGDFGGTWYWNRYPGAMCDIESYIYLPLLEELGYVPSEKYVKAKEILEHSQRMGERYGLYENALFQTEAQELHWNDEHRRWIVSTNRRDAIRARFVVMSSGPLHRPKLPGISGIETYEGHSFHTSRWDYDYTGGGPEGDLVGLAGKRVGIIGTGATAVQAVPHLAAGAAELFVFQRTPSSIDVRNNKPTDPTWAASLEPGWQQRRMENFNNLLTGKPEAEDLVDDGWTDIIGNLLVRIRSAGDNADLSAEGLRRTMELADFQKMNQIRERVDATVTDQDTADSLKPWYRQFCKRPCFHDQYLQAFNEPNVTLVDTLGKGVDRITPQGIVAGGTEYELDCIIYATGFEVGTGFTRRAGCEPYGRNALSLTDKWANGVRTLHGMHVHAFPNLFVVSSSQGGFTANYPHLLDEVSAHIAYVIAAATTRDATVVEASARAEDDWVETIVGLARNNLSFLEDCTPGYYNNEGKPGDRSGQNTSYGKGSVQFFELLAKWRDEGTLAGLHFS